MWNRDPVNPIEIVRVNVDVYGVFFSQQFRVLFFSKIEKIFI